VSVFRLESATAALYLGFLEGTTSEPARISAATSATLLRIDSETTGLIPAIPTPFDGRYVDELAALGAGACAPLRLAAP
jgi:hypothetical protein